MLIHTPRLRLMTMERAHLAAIVRDPLSLGDLLRIGIPEGWPAFPAAYPHALALLKKEPLRSCSGWWLYLFVDPVHQFLVGCGGFKDAPDANGVVEIGCEIAPAFRCQGFATEAMRGLINYACTRPEVRAIDAYSKAEPGAQASLLQIVGMTRIGETLEANADIVWHWRVTSDAFVNARRAGME
jgi:[ribosomal protein S5]-alanine N-acetyltransferase